MSTDGQKGLYTHPRADTPNLHPDGHETQLTDGREEEHFYTPSQIGFIDSNILLSRFMTVQLDQSDPIH